MPVTADLARNGSNAAERGDAAPPRRRRIAAVVLKNRALCREHYRLDLLVSSFAESHPGEFIQIYCHQRLDDLDPQPMDWCPGTPIHFSDADLTSVQTMLARPFSIACREDTREGVVLSVIHRVVGTGTAWLAARSAGDSVTILGPLGNRFTPPAEGTTAMLVGGGVGIPPMLYLAERLRGGRAIAFCGATTLDLLPLNIDDAAATHDSSRVNPRLCTSEFNASGIPAVVTTDDGSYGFRGYVTQALEKYLDEQAADTSFRPEIFTCGPEPMMRRVADIAIQRNLPCQVAVERAMACGMGTCQSCVIKIRCPGGWRYQLSCTDGPIFKAHDLLW